MHQQRRRADGRLLHRGLDLDPQADADAHADAELRRSIRRSRRRPTASQTTAAATDNNASGGNKSSGKNSGLAKTGPEDATRTMLIALVALQVGLIAWFRWGRKPAYAGTHRGAHR